MPNSIPAACVAVWIGLGAFVVTLVIAAWLYPGGSWADPDAPGFRPFVNYWCDLMRTVSANGEPNGASSTAARTAFWILAPSLLLYWPLAGKLCSGRLLTRVILVSGSISAICVALLAMLPYDTNQRSHAVVTLGAGGCGFVAMLLAVLGALQSGPLVCWRNAWAAATLGAASLNLVLYTRIILSDQTESAALPAVQKFATLFLLLWMAATTLRVWRR